MHARVADEEPPGGSSPPSEPATDTAAEAERLAPDLGTPVATVREHLALMPPEYAATVSARSIVRHAGMAADRPAGGEVHTRMTPGELSGTGDTPSHVLDVVALDRPGLFAKVAGVLTLHGGDVMAASAFTREDDLAVDSFTIRRPTERTGSFWAHVEGDIVEAMAGRLALRARISRRLRGDGGVDRGGGVGTRVTVEALPAGDRSRVEVHTADHPGVLFAITSAMAELELDIVAAAIETVGGEAADVFHVRNASGEPLDPHHAAEVELSITVALEE